MGTFYCTYCGAAMALPPGPAQDRVRCGTCRQENLLPASLRAVRPGVVAVAPATVQTPPLPRSSRVGRPPQLSPAEAVGPPPPPARPTTGPRSIHWALYAGLGLIAAINMFALLRGILAGNTPVEANTAPTQPTGPVLSELSAPPQAPALPPEPRQTAPKSGNAAGPAQVLRTFASDMEALNATYRASLDEASLDRILTPAWIQQDANLAAARKNLTQAETLLTLYDDKMVKAFTAAALNLQQQEQAGTPRAGEALDHLNRLGDQLDLHLGVEHDLLDCYDEVLLLLEHSEGGWSVQQDAVIFADADEAEIYRQLQLDIVSLAQEAREAGMGGQ